MKKLYVELVTDSLTLEGIDPCDIHVDSYETGYSIIRFGDQLAVNLANFISYQFKQDEEQGCCCSNNE